MIVRERSNVSESPRKAPNWPPKSPLQAILSSPNSKRMRDRQTHERPVSPSPIKRAFSPSKNHAAPMSVSSSDGDEDEETLQLKLKAIEAKLKLKKLQQAKWKRKDTSASSDDPFQAAQSSSQASIRDRRPLEDRGPVIDVPVSPPRSRQLPTEPRSPARVLLGIDKGLRAQNVSLKRPPNAHGATAARQASNLQSKSGSYRASGVQLKDADLPKPKSFSERIAEGRITDREIQEKKDRLEKSRSRGFGLSAELKSERSLLPSVRIGSQEDDHVQQQLREHSSSVKANLATASTTRARPNLERAESDSIDLGSGLEPYSGTHLSSRKLNHQTLTRVLAEKTLYPLPKLLKVVKGPSFDPPDVEGDFVVFGIIASKSTPRDHNARKTTTSADADDDAKATGKHKFMALRLTDLKWEIDLFLFDTAFSRFWKLTPGTVVAVLNPGIMPPRQGREDTGMFALKLASSEDTVLEIGTARDLGFCKSVKKDGQECSSWINKKKTEFCEFHVNLQVERARASRMEVNSMVRFGQRDKNGEKYINSRGVSKQELVGRGLLSAGGRQFDYETKERFYAVPTRAGRNAAGLMDEAEFGSQRDRQARLDKRRKEREKESTLAEQLGKIGGKAGGEYMRQRRGADGSSNKNGSSTLQSSSQLTQDDTGDPVQGLLGRKAVDVTLSPVRKRKRTAGGGTSSEPVGWGGAFKRGLLLSPKKPTHPPDDGSETGSWSPSKKRARFMLEDKGLREPGRDSFGVVGNDIANDDDDDDDLDIIR